MSNQEDDYGAELDDIVQKTEENIKKQQENKPKSFLQSAMANNANNAQTQEEQSQPQPINHEMPGPEDMANLDKMM